MMQSRLVGIVPAAARRPDADLHDLVEVVPVRLAGNRRVDLAKVEQGQNGVVKRLGALQVRDGEIGVVEADDLDAFGNEFVHVHALAITLSRNRPQASSSDNATNSSALCACSIDPGPQITDGMPAC